MQEKITFFINRMKEKLWLKPLFICLLSVAAALLAHSADDLFNKNHVMNLIPEISGESIEDLLKITATSMLVIATFAVASMVSAYASASSTATPRALSVVISDDTSQNALSTFIGAFIFSIVGLVALKNGYYGKAGLLVLFTLTLTALAVVIVTFLRWVDRIARLGRLGTVIDKVEAAAFGALMRRGNQPTLKGAEIDESITGGLPLFSKMIGYIQRIDLDTLQQLAEQYKIRIAINSLPGNFVTPERTLAFIYDDQYKPASNINTAELLKAFVIGQDRLFDNDPRFGIIALSEIATRALSPAVNDPGTAIDVIGTLVRLFLQYSAARSNNNQIPCYDRVQVPQLCIRDMFDDAFIPIARDSASIVEVQVRLQKALFSLAASGDPIMKETARHHARRALLQAQEKLHLPEDIETIRSAGLLK